MDAVISLGWDARIGDCTVDLALDIQHIRVAFTEVSSQQNGIEDRLSIGSVSVICSFGREGDLAKELSKASTADGVQRSTT